MDRRRLLQIAGAGALGTVPLLACPAKAQLAPTIAPGGLLPIRLSPSQIMRITVCLRPFRAAGPRIETEQVGRKLVVHNYGHGGSGWSLSWGSAEVAVKLAMQSSPTRIAVIGAGALGLTTALMAQRAGLDVTIYAKERFPHVRSSRATGIWSPDSRIAKADSVTPDFADRWEHMARASYAMHQSFVGLAGNPVEWMDQYYPRPSRPAPEPNAPPEPEPFPDPGFLYLEDRLGDIVPHSQEVPQGQHPFVGDKVMRANALTFNVAALAHQLTEDFLVAGGTFVPAEFHAPSDLGRLKEKVIINCTGYGARALFRDDSIVPVRGQIVWLAPQENVHYGFYYNRVSVLARRDGIVVQALQGEGFGWNDDNETPDMAAAHASILAAARVYAPAPAAPPTPAA